MSDSECLVMCITPIDIRSLPLLEFYIVLVSVGNVLLSFLFIISIVSVTVVHVQFLPLPEVNIFSVLGCYISFFLLS